MASIELTGDLKMYFLIVLLAIGLCAADPKTTPTPLKTTTTTKAPSTTTKVTTPSTTSSTKAIGNPFQYLYWRKCTVNITIQQDASVDLLLSQLKRIVGPISISSYKFFSDANGRPRQIMDVELLYSGYPWNDQNTFLTPEWRALCPQSIRALPMEMDYFDQIVHEALENKRIINHYVSILPVQMRA